MEFTFDPTTRTAAWWAPSLIGDLFAGRGMCGRSLNRGLLRFHDAESAPSSQSAVDAMYGTRGLETQVFGFDWLARQFAVTDQLTFEGTPDPSRTSRTVVVLDPFDGSITPWVDIQKFEGALSTPLAQEFLLPKMFGDWMSTVGIGNLEFGWCAGASVPSFYGGRREIENLTLDMVEVYLSFAQQLWEHRQKFGPNSPPPRLTTAEGQ